MQTATFTFAGHNGTATRDLKGTFVWWGGMAFQIEAAKPELRQAIEEAFQRPDPRNRQALLSGLSRNARKSYYARG